MKKLMRHEDPERIIRTLNISNEEGLIKIEFLDGTTHVLPLNERNLLLVRNEISNQAKDRIGYSDKYYIKKKKVEIGMATFDTLMSAMCFYIGSNPYSKTKLVLGCAWAGCTLCKILSIIDIQGKLNEIEKYQIFNKIKGSLEKHTSDQNLFSGVSSTCKHIEDVDSVSLKEMRRIRSNLDRINRFTRYEE